MHHIACGILVPQPGIEPLSPELEAWSLNHWALREVPLPRYFYGSLSFFLSLSHSPFRSLLKSYLFKEIYQTTHPT